MNVAGHICVTLPVTLEKHDWTLFIGGNPKKGEKNECILFLGHLSETLYFCWDCWVPRVYALISLRKKVTAEEEKKFRLPGAKSK